MAVKDTPTPAPTAAGGKSFVQRELNGATFLTLEHVAHMILVVAVPALLVTGILYALAMWTGSPSISHMMMGGPGLASMPGTKAIDATLALGVVAALLVLAPALFVFDRRTRAEWHKRSGYAGRLAYKAPVYTALAVLGALMVCLKIEM